MERQTQTKIDFTRAEQLGLLRELQLEPLPAKDGRRVGSTTLKAILKAVDDFAGGRGWAWPSFDTLASAAGCSVRSAKRAVEVLERASLLVVETRRNGAGGVSNHYLIVWSELALLASRTGVAECNRCTPLGSDQSATSVNQSATGANQSATSVNQSATGALKAYEAPKNRPEPPERAAAGGWSELVDEWRGRVGQVVELAREARERGETVAAFRERLAAAWSTATSTANAGKFERPAGAVVFYLRRGEWPAAGVIDASDSAATAAAVAQREQLERRRRFESDVKAAGLFLYDARRRRVADEEIERELRRRWAADVVVALGWGHAVAGG